MSRRNAVLVFIALILIWGVNWPIMKVGLTHISPGWFTSLRMLLSIPCLFAILFAQGRARLPASQDVPVLLSVGLLQMALFMGLTNFALQRVPAGRGAILAYATPLFVTPLAAIFLKERMTTLKLLGVALGMLGVVALFNPWSFDWSDGRIVLGNGLLMLAAFLWAVCIVHVRRHRWYGTTLELMPWQMAVGAVPLVIFAYFHEGPLHIDWSTALGLILFYNGPIAAAFGFWASVTVNKSLPATTLSLGFLGVPLTGAITAAIALGEPLTAALVTGLVLILGGVGITALADRRTA